MIDVTPAFVKVTEDPKATAPPPLIPVPAVTVTDELVNEPFAILLNVFDAPLIVLFVSVCVPVFKTTSSSDPKGPAIHLSFVVSHNNEPDTNVLAVASLTTKPAFVAPVPLSWIILSAIANVVELIVVCVPETTKLPPIVTVVPSSVIDESPTVDDDVNLTTLLLVPDVVIDVPEEPLEPDEPEVPEEPLVPEEPDEPEVPEEPDVPEEPLEPDEPDEPDVPDEPLEPDVPAVPDEPDEPDVPDEPLEPDVPEEPLEPDVPAVPDEPLEPDVPDEPEVPAVPDEPDEPFDPLEPDVPEEPLEPDVPAVPDEPLEPEVPEDPFDPLEPEVPEVPEVDAVYEVPLITTSFVT